MASQIQDEFGERGLVYIQTVYGGSYGDYRDAQQWAYQMDHNGDGTTEKLDIIVLADYDQGIYNRFADNCSGLSGTQAILCAASCPVTPVIQIIDPGGVTLKDCTRGTGYQCSGTCGMDTNGLRSFLDQILPPKGCGEAPPP